jgi:hypothetical protein
MPVYNYAVELLSDGATRNIKLHDITHEIEAAFPDESFTTKLLPGTGGLAVSSTNALDQATLDMVITVHKAGAQAACLVCNRSHRIQEIDTRTEGIIAGGFTHSDKQFSLSLESQINWTNAGLNAGALTYPYRVATNLDDDYHDFVDIAEMQTAYMEALTAKSIALITGANLKKALNEATTQAELDAIVDTR